MVYLEGWFAKSLSDARLSRYAREEVEVDVSMVVGHMMMVCLKMVDATVSQRRVPRQWWLQWALRSQMRFCMNLLWVVYRIVVSVVLDAHIAYGSDCSRSCSLKIQRRRSSYDYDTLALNLER